MGEKRPGRLCPRESHVGSRPSPDSGLTSQGGVVGRHMDELKAQIATQKRKAAAPPAGGVDKYMRRGEKERSVIDAPGAARSDERTDAKPPTSAAQPADASPSHEALHDEQTCAPPRTQLLKDEIMRRLRLRHEPVRLFGETDDARQQRLRALELTEERDKRGQNDFMRVLQGTERELAHEAFKRDAEAPAQKPSARQREGIGMHSRLDLNLLHTDPARVYPLVYYTIKELLADWETLLARRSDDVRHSTDGRLATAKHAQTAEYLRPLLKQLRRRTLDYEVLGKLAEIVYCMQLREYRQANDVYLQLSIGDAPWPIGITGVKYVLCANRH